MSVEVLDPVLVRQFGFLHDPVQLAALLHFVVGLKSQVKGEFRDQGDNVKKEYC
jgi:hypothetical protein